MDEDNGMTAAAHGASPIGCADAVKEVRFASTIDRDSAVEMMKALSNIESLLEGVTHGIAKKIKSQMAVFEQVADDAFPGGYAGECCYCESPIGYDEQVNLGDESCCPACWEKRKADMAACKHEYGPEEDVHGDPINYCMKCGHAIGMDFDQPRGLSAAEGASPEGVNHTIAESEDNKRG